MNQKYLDLEMGNGEPSLASLYIYAYLLLN